MLDDNFSAGTMDGESGQTSDRQGLCGAGDVDGSRGEAGAVGAGKIKSQDVDAYIAHSRISSSLPHSSSKSSSAGRPSSE